MRDGPLPLHVPGCVEFELTMLLLSQPVAVAVWQGARLGEDELLPATVLAQAPHPSTSAEATPQARPARIPFTVPQPTLSTLC